MVRPGGVYLRFRVLGFRGLGSGFGFKGKGWGQKVQVSSF